MTTAKYYIPSGRCIQAIDYSDRDEDGNGRVIPDSLRREFKTKSGRIVLDGAGIEPDEEVAAKGYAPITYSLVARNLVFNYANEFFLKNDSIAPPREYEISDELYQDFVTWLENKEYDYTTRVEKAIEDLVSYSEKEKYYDDIKHEIASLKKSVTHSKEQDLITFKEEIKGALKDEIVSRYYYEQGMVEASLDEDVEINQSIQVLNDQDQYASMLKPGEKRNG